METIIESYYRIRTVEDKFAKLVFDYPVIIEEKVDGSQISFMVDENKKLWIKSKSVMFDEDANFKSFSSAISELKKLKDGMVINAVYRGEYLQKTKHNVIKYDRIPDHNIVGYDISIDGKYVPYAIKNQMFRDIGLETVPLLFMGETNREEAEKLLVRDSFLGGSKIEGIVIKHRSDARDVVAKLVSDQFKERTKLRVRPRLGTNDLIQEIGNTYRNEARWNKAIAHLRDEDQLSGSMTDIGLLIRAVNLDVLEECGEEIKDLLFKQYWKTISKQITNGLPDWYKEKLEA